MENFEVQLASRPGADAVPSCDNFKYVACEAPALADNDIIIKTLYLSVDPMMRCRMNASTGVQYMDAWPLNEAVEGTAGVGVVTATNCPQFKVGCFVGAEFGWPWKKFFAANAAKHSLRLSLRMLNEDCIEKRWYTLPLSCTGMVGLTALLGVQEHGKPHLGDTCVVTAAAGATGSLAGQIARLMGCANVVGVCGTDAKCRVIREELGFTATINYKTENLKNRLKELCPKGINVYFDNVGGTTSDTIVLQMKPKGRVVLCGQIAMYNTDQAYPPPLGDDADLHADMNEIERERFLVLNYQEKWEASMKQLQAWIKDGSLKVKETTYEGLENAGKAFVDMMQGANIGKMIVKVAEPPEESAV